MYENQFFNLRIYSKYVQKVYTDLQSLFLYWAAYFSVQRIIKYLM